MCGIVGEFITNGFLTERSVFKKLNNLNYHRGPDMDGYWTNEKNCQLGFRRLSILDLSTDGNQPISSNNNRYIMTFNGEIYNYLEIKEDLIKKGIKFKSTTDSEVLVNSFQEYGINQTLDKIDGMYAIGLYDKEENSVYLMRDFAGIKPLFYGIDNKNLIFGSRYDQITKHPNYINKGINEDVLHTYLQSHYLPAPYAIQNDTYQVEPGELIKFNSEGKVTKKYFWRLPKVDISSVIEDKNEALNLLTNSIGESVKSELIADVPVGTFLSGGIDSPLITYFANSFSPNIKSYTIGSDCNILDETEKAKEYANLIGCNHIISSLDSSGAVNVLESCMEHLQEPFADFSLIPTYLVSEMAKQNGDVVLLSGDGADELFYGYTRFESLLKNIKFNFIPKPMRYTAYGIDKILFKNKHINANFIKENYAKAHRGMHSRIHIEEIKSIFKTDKVNQLPLPSYNYKNNKSEIEILFDMQQAEYYDMMQKTLTKVDRMSMAHSIEVRVPFLRKTVIESAMKLHPYLSYNDKGTKVILKDLLKKLVPNSPIDKVKKGFTIPLEKWLREQLKEPFEDVLFSKSFLNEFNISESVLQRIWNEHQTKSRDRKWILFTLYSLAKWNENLKK